MAKRNSVRIAGITISMSWLAFLTLAVWVKAMMIKFEDFFFVHVNAILIITSLLVLFFVGVGVISFRALLARGKNFVD